VRVVFNLKAQKYAEEKIHIYFSGEHDFKLSSNILLSWK